MRSRGHDIATLIVEGHSRSDSWITHHLVKDNMPASGTENSRQFVELPSKFKNNWTLTSLYQQKEQVSVLKNLSIVGYI